MSEWLECKLVDMAELVKDKYTPVKGDDLKYIGLEHIQEQALRLIGIGNSDDITSDKFRFKQGDILFGKLRPYFRKVVQPKFDGVCSTDIWVVRAINGVNQNFLYYLFASKEFVDLSNSGEAGTRMPRADWKFMRQTSWNIPEDEKEQRAIAGVLSSLDDKIDLLHRQNRTLEGMAEALFREWFVEDADEGWEEVKLAQFVEVMRGLSYKGAGLCSEDSGVPMHNLNSVYEGGDYKYEGIKYYSGDYKERHLVSPGDVIITNTEQGHDLLLIGYPAIVPKFFGDIGIFSQHIYKLRIKDEYISETFLYYLLMSYGVREQITGATNGSTVNMLPKDGIEWVKFKLPPESKIMKFTQIIKPYVERKELIHSQIYSIEKLRDMLLPKLMSGKVRTEVKSVIGNSEKLSEEVEG